MASSAQDAARAPGSAAATTPRAIAAHPDHPLCGLLPAAAQDQDGRVCKGALKSVVDRCPAQVLVTTTQGELYSEFPTLGRTNTQTLSLRIQAQVAHTQTVRHRKILPAPRLQGAQSLIPVRPLLGRHLVNRFVAGTFSDCKQLT